MAATPTGIAVRSEREIDALDARVLNLLVGDMSTYVLYQVTKSDKSQNTIRAVDEIVIHQQRFESTNLACPFDGNVVMKDLRILERALTADFVEHLSDGALLHILGNLAQNQQSQLKNKTLLFDFSMFPFNRALFMIKEDARKLVNQGMGNIFEKEMLIFPMIDYRHSYLTIVTSPRGALSGEPDQCQLWTFGTGEMRKYKEDVHIQIFDFLETCACHYEPTKRFRWSHVSESICELKRVEKYDRAMAIIMVLKKILSEEEDLPDMGLLMRDFRNTTDNSWRTQTRAIQAVRESTANSLVTALRSNNNDLVQYLLDVRAEVVAKEKASELARRVVHSDPINLD